MGCITVLLNLVNSVMLTYIISITNHMSVIISEHVNCIIVLQLEAGISAYFLVVVCLKWSGGYYSKIHFPRSREMCNIAHVT